MGGVWLQFVIVISLNILNGFFSASEIAIVSARRGRLQQRAESGNAGARTALELADEPNRFLATVQVGITLISVFTAAFGGDALSEPVGLLLQPYLGPRYASTVAFALIVLLLTYLSLILGELVPKRLALQRAEGVAAFVAPIMRGISWGAAPVVWFLTISTQAVLRLLGRGHQTEEQVTEEDVMSLVREGAEGGSLEASERDLIERVFEFTDATARSIMTPRTEIAAVSIDTPLHEVMAQIVESGYSRIPVYHGSLDTIEGVIYAKDVLKAALENDSRNADIQLKTLLRPPVFVLEHQRIASVLQQLKQTRTHLALVLDEYGQVDGLITLEDVLEELTGDIADEYDETDPMVVRRPDGSYLINGLLSYADAEHRLDLPPRSELGHLPSFDTIAGLVLALLEHIPTTGETVSLQDWQFEVVDMDGVRIDKLLARRNPLNSDRAQSEASLAIGAVLPGADSPQQGRSQQRPPNTNGQA
jgi:putative hemolysin